jgi:hypothetical protein
MFKRFVQQDALDDVDLAPDEEIIWITQRHVVMLVLRMLLPTLLFLISGGIAIYRYLGGRFLVADVRPGGQFTSFDGVLTGLMVVALLVWLFTRRWKFISASLLLLGAKLFAWIVFRYQGGRVFYIDPFDPYPVDLLTVVATLVAVLAILWAIYVFMDWSTDQLILTNQRVIYDKETPLVRRMQEQLPIIDIQQVKVRTRTYLEHWLNFGSIAIESAAYGHTIAFRAARDPQQMQKRIMREVDKIQQEESDANFQRLIETRIYRNLKPKVALKRTPRQTATPRLLGLLFTENPEFDVERESYTWHPHWIFLVKALVWPLTGLVLTLLVVFSAAAVGIIVGGALLVVLLVVALVFMGWAAWEIEDHRNAEGVPDEPQVAQVRP